MLPEVWAVSLTVHEESQAPQRHLACYASCNIGLLTTMLNVAYLTYVVLNVTMFCLPWLIGSSMVLIRMLNAVHYVMLNVMQFYACIGYYSAHNHLLNFAHLTYVVLNVTMFCLPWLIGSSMVLITMLNAVHYVMLNVMQFYACIGYYSAHSHLLNFAHLTYVVLNVIQFFCLPWLIGSSMGLITVLNAVHLVYVMLNVIQFCACIS